MHIRTWITGAALLATFSLPVRGETEITPFLGYRFANNVALRSDTTTTTDTLKFSDSSSFGILVNGDIDPYGRQYQLYYSHQDTRASVGQPALFSGISQFDVSIDRLQFGGLYFPGGVSSLGFIAGTLGITRMSPDAAGLETDYQPSISLGGGAKLPLGQHLLLRFDLRGIYTALHTNAAIFCSGGCTARVDSHGFFQMETAVGLGFRF
ncbi:hypothetical protein [Mangrovitalea sediminis]|uniref:hypothetical protein n=1 Tax=Mangrovitalea sediminis TaxID=1982043 RepID=UPI000BE527C8|nr:hypothetical protein [Mangrovitalea sediminis]